MTSGAAKRYVLLIDRSASMNATDESPSRLEAAKRQAKTLVASAGEATLRLELDKFEAVERKVALGTDSSLELALKAAPRKSTDPGPKKPKPEANPDGILDPFAK